MAKKTKEGPSKSDSIRAYLAENPKAGPTEIAQALAAKGIEVSIPLVSALKAKAKGGGRGKKRGATRGGRKTTAGGSKVSLETLLAAKKMAQQLGGVDKAREALDLLEKLL
jgi:hypothetical protein